MRNRSSVWCYRLVMPSITTAPLYFATAPIFLAQAVGIDMTLAQQLGLLGVLLVTSKAERASRARQSLYWFRR